MTVCEFMHNKPDRVKRLNRRIIRLQKSAQRVMTSQPVRRFQNSIIGALSVAGLTQGTPKAQADAGMSEIKQQLIWKDQRNHCGIDLAPRFDSSGERCSKSGWRMGNSSGNCDGCLRPAE